MKNKYVFVAVLLVVLTIGSFALSMTGTTIEKKEDELLVVTSFYPVYIATLNVADQVEGVQVQCLTQTNTGCVHDIQLTTQDMRLLEQADVFIVNGADMESYLDSIKERYPNLQIVDTSEGTEILESSGEHHHEDEEVIHEESDHDEEEDVHENHEHEDISDVHVEAHDTKEEVAEHDHNHVHNAHVWLNMDNYSIQVENIGNALAEMDKEHQSQYRNNVETYQQKIRNLQSQGKEVSDMGDVHVVSTHEAFSYFAENFNWHVAQTVNMDENTSLKAQEVSEMIELVEKEQIAYVFTEELYGTALSDVLEEETECQIILLDTLVTGTADKDAYLKGMEKNLEALKEVLSHE